MRKSNWEIIFSNFDSEKKPIDPKFQGKTPKNIFDINGIKTSQKVIDPISQPIHPNESLKNTTTSPKFASKMSQIWLQTPTFHWRTCIWKIVKVKETPSLGSWPRLMIGGVVEDMQVVGWWWILGFPLLSKTQWEKGKFLISGSVQCFCWNIEWLLTKWVEQYSFAKNNKTVFKQNNFIKLCQSSTQGRLPEQEWYTMLCYFFQDFQEHRVEQGHEHVFVNGKVLVHYPSFHHGCAFARFVV